jgi:hypothetical protein
VGIITWRHYYNYSFFYYDTFFYFYFMPRDVVYLFLFTFSCFSVYTRRLCLFFCIYILSNGVIYLLFIYLLSIVFIVYSFSHSSIMPRCVLFQGIYSFFVFVYLSCHVVCCVLLLLTYVCIHLAFICLLMYFLVFIYQYQVFIYSFMMPQRLIFLCFCNMPRC